MTAKPLFKTRSIENDNLPSLYKRGWNAKWEFQIQCQQHSQYSSKYILASKHHLLNQYNSKQRWFFTVCMYLGFLAQDIHRNSQPVFTQSQMHYFHTFDKRFIFPELDGVIFPSLCSNFSGFGPRSSRGTSLKLLPCVVGWHWAFERRTLWDLFTPCPAEVIAMYMEKSLNLGKGLVGWIGEWVGGWIVGWVGGWVDGWVEHTWYL